MTGPLLASAAMRVVVTGCAGFIGSHLVERLLADGAGVVGIDSFSDYYPRADKERNLDALRDEPSFTLIEGDLATMDLTAVMGERPAVAHLAAQPGVRGSFGEAFARYAHDNIIATQRVFEAARAAGAHNVVWASSSSVYGNAAEYPCVEATTPTRPVSPYGVTKRACEDLAAVYRGMGLRVTGLRFFTVYGPRQRPDMAMRRLCEAAVGGPEFRVFGSGEQSRDFTYVDDAVGAVAAALGCPEAGLLYNVGGGQEATLNEVIDLVGELAGGALNLLREGTQQGDVVRTSADTSAAKQDLGWRPEVGLRDGLTAQLDWVRARVPEAAAG